MADSKTILVLPGTLWQVPLVKKIKEMGHKVLIVSPSPDSPCFEYADGYLQSDIFAKDKVIEYGKRNHIDAIMSDECDIAMNLVAELGKEFDVPALDIETAALFTDKYLMREFCREHGFHYPEYKLCKTEEDAVIFLKQIDKPVIIKPIDSNASHGVFRCETVIDINKHFNESLSFSRLEKAVLIERFIDGTEFTIDGIKTPSSHYTMAISEKKHFIHNENIANELYFTHTNNNYDYDKLREQNDSLIMQTSLHFGFTHAEYKYEDGEFYLIEIAARGGGNMISSCITQWMSGYDTYKYLVKCSINQIHEEDFSLRPKYKDRASVLKFFATPGGGGRVSKVEGIDMLEKEDDVKFYNFNFKVGDIIQDPTSDSARIGYYIACSENEIRLKKVMELIDRKVKIILI